MHLLPPRESEFDVKLLNELRELGRNYGPLGVAIAASALTDPNVLVASIETHTVRQRDETTDAMPDAHRSGPTAEEVDHGY